MRHTVRYLILAIVVIVLLKVSVWLIIPFIPWLIAIVAVIIIFGSLINRRLPF